MIIKEHLPEFNIEDDDLIKRYSDELKRVQTLDDLVAITKKWAVFWLADHQHKEGFVREVDRKIVEGSITDEDLLCVKVSFIVQPSGEIGIPCEHMLPKYPCDSTGMYMEGPPEPSKLCVGMEIRLPWSAISAVLVAHRYGAPVNAAFHQLFCTGPHDLCF